MSYIGTFSRNIIVVNLGKVVERDELIQKLDMFYHGIIILKDQAKLPVKEEETC